jgi:thiosulfate/3-mercaptopyruvate sulfurtransferase
MIFTTLITTTELARHLDDQDWVILDCRFTLTDPPRGRGDYLQAHIPGAVYAHLDEDLSGRVVQGQTGRHPLPSVETTARTFSNWGIAPGVQVVVYDDAGGALAAGRAWWMLRWLGHEAVAVLDGGWGVWSSSKLGRRSGEETFSSRQFIPHERPELVISAAQVETIRLDNSWRLYDARSRERYHGENETIDPIAGHIPGAISAPYTDSLTSTNTFRPVNELGPLYQALSGDVPAEKTVFYCGSGVTSIVNILAIAHAGLGEARLYAGSWSEWITGPQRPVEK